MKHSETPFATPLRASEYEISDAGDTRWAIYDSSVPYKCVASEIECQETADSIVCAVNAHDKLAFALRQMAETYPPQGPPATWEHKLHAEVKKALRLAEELTTG